MSRLWTSELRLNLRVSDCYAELRAPGWRRHPVQASANASGRGAAAIQAALAALRLVEPELQATDVRLTVADEYVYYALLAGPRDAAEAQRRASQVLTEGLGRNDLQVQISPLPGRHRSWLAAAVTRSDLAAWRSALSAAGLHLRHLHPALVEDLRELAEQVPEDHAVLALLREEGAMLVRLREGVPAAIEWERLDIGNRHALEAHLRAFVRRTQSELKPDSVQPSTLPVYLRAESHALCRYRWQLDAPGLRPEPPASPPEVKRWRFRPWARPQRHDPNADTVPGPLADTQPPATTRALPDMPDDPWLNTQPTPDWHPQTRPALAEHIAQRRRKARS
ncbi:MAG: hypothetical protein AB3X44_06985 [Leptothrix sp. (in: b-proteobacteria)]